MGYPGHNLVGIPSQNIREISKLERIKDGGKSAIGENYVANVA